MGRWKLAKLNGMTRVNPINEMRFEQKLKGEGISKVGIFEINISNIVARSCHKIQIF